VHPSRRFERGVTMRCGTRQDPSQIPGLEATSRPLDEFVDFIRRVQIPNYDAARVCLKHPQVLEDSWTPASSCRTDPKRSSASAGDPDYES
jgi:hypothetical protein